MLNFMNVSIQGPSVKKNIDYFRFGQNANSSTNDTTVKVVAVRENVANLFYYRLKVIFNPNLLQENKIIVA